MKTCLMVPLNSSFSTKLYSELMNKESKNGKIGATQCTGTGAAMPSLICAYFFFFSPLFFLFVF